MDYNIKAIPTMYKGLLFDSRLEATWACFFDLIGWKWIYHPFDFDKWFPDFLIDGDTKILVEVKPITDFKSVRDSELLKNMETCVMEYGEGLNIRCEPLLLGTGPFASDCCWKCMCLGWCCEMVGGEDQKMHPWWDNALLCEFQKIAKEADTVGYFHREGIWSDRISGAYKSDDAPNVLVDMDKDNSYMPLWNKAKNTVRYNHKQKGA